MIKILFILLLPNGELMLKPHYFLKPITVHECWAFGQNYREKNTTYNNKRNVHYLNNTKILFNGFICE
tara:strand:- start:905 stop:1108 length:204 start_codon:yes stop_codon:yes gene_type:complete